MAKTKRKMMTGEVDIDVVDFIKSIAKKDGVPVSQITRKLLREAMESRLAKEAQEQIT